MSVLVIAALALAATAWVLFLAVQARDVAAGRRRTRAITQAAEHITREGSP